MLGPADKPIRNRANSVPSHSGISNNSIAVTNYEQQQEQIYRTENLTVTWDLGMWKIEVESGVRGLELLKGQVRELVRNLVCSMWDGNDRVLALEKVQRRVGVVEELRFQSFSRCLTAGEGHTSFILWHLWFAYLIVSHSTAARLPLQKWAVFDG
jgi:hypothetical protein